MARNIVITCDRCGKNGATEGIYYVSTGETRSDPAGGPSESIDYIADLCVSCEIVLLKLMVSYLSEDIKRKIVREFKRKDAPNIGVFHKN